MAANPPVNTNTDAPDATNIIVAAEDIGGVTHPLVKLEHGAPGAAVPVSAAAPLPVSVLNATPIAVDGSGATQPVSAASLPLPTGAATQATLASLEAKAPTLVGGSVPVVVQNQGAGAGLATEATLQNVNAKLPALVDGRLPVQVQINGNPVPVTIAGETVAVSAVQLPLPNGAATQATLANLEAKIPAQVNGRIPVEVYPSVSPVVVADGGGSLTVDGTVGISGTVPVSAASLPLPTGAATQTTLASLDTKTPALGQAVMASSTPVVIASNQSAIPVADGGGSLTVDGSVSIAGSVAVTGPLTDAQLRASSVPVTMQTLNVVDAGNSTTTTLGAGATFTGAAVDLLGYSAIAASFFSDVNSAPNGVIAQFSPDGVNWDNRVRNTYEADGSTSDVVIRPHDRYFRAVYTNDGVAQTVFRMQVILCRLAPTLADSCGVDHPPTSGDDAMIVKAVIAGRSSAGGGTYVDVKVNPSGSLAIGGGLTLTDAMANPTDAQATAAMCVGYNGVTWDRLRSSKQNGLEVDCTRIRVHESAFTPGYDGPSALPEELNTDPEGHLVIRGPIHTDESSFRVNFANSSIAISIGSPTRVGDVFTGGSLGLTTLDLHVGDYVKFDADPESAWCQVEALDGNTATVFGYTGSAVSGPASRSLVQPFTGTGGSIAVASGQCTIGSGTTANAITGLKRVVDIAPVIHRCRFSLSQRIANQTWIAGLEEDSATPRWFARFSASGTTANAIVCETGRNPTGAPSAAETQSTTITLPNGRTTATAAEYRVELLTERVVFFIDGVLVAEHTQTIPAQHDEMTSVTRWANGASVPASNTNAVVDFLTAKNHNKLEIGIMSDAEKLLAAIQPMKEFAFSQAGVIAINTDLLVIDCRQLATVNVQCLAMGTTGVVTPQWSNDPAFSIVSGATMTTPAGADAATFNAAGLWSLPVLGRYLRLRLTTATTAGTTTLAVNGTSFPTSTRLATQPVSGTVAVSTIAGAITPGVAATSLGKAEDAVAASGDTGVFMLGVRRDALTTSASATGDYNEIAVSRHGSVQVGDFRTSARTFRAAMQINSVAATPTDVVDIAGNATTTVVVTRICVSGTATSANQADMLIVKRSTANSGARNAAVAVPLDASDAAANSVPGYYTANPTTGTSVGPIGRHFVPLSTNASGGEASHEWTFGERGKGVVLSGTAQVLALNLNGVTIAGAVLDVEIEWYEF